MTGKLLLLLIAFQVKHFICDYPLQTEFMLKKNSERSIIWIPALTCHCIVHALGTLTITMIINPRFVWLSLIDFALHFIVDRLKASPKLGGRWPLPTDGFWNALGMDQMAHHIFNILFVWLLVR